MTHSPEHLHQFESISDGTRDNSALSAQLSLANPEHSAMASAMGVANPNLVASLGFPSGEDLLPLAGDAASSSQFMTNFYVERNGMQPGVDAITSASASGSDEGLARYQANEELNDLTGVDRNLAA